MRRAHPCPGKVAAPPAAATPTPAGGKIRREHTARQPRYAIPTLRRTFCWGLLLVAAAPACRLESQDPPSPARVLFIGNSLTYFNDLPTLMTRLADQVGDSALETAMVARPDYSLSDHWNEGTALAELRAKRWDYVVMQQGPSSLPENAELLRVWAERFDPVVRKAGAQPVLYMVWPSLSRASDLERVRESYRAAAAEVNGIFAPAGDALGLARAADPLAPVYGPDGFHPSLEGSYVAAVVLLARVRGIEPGSLPPVIPGSPLAEPEVRALQRAAAAALARNPARP
jgi:hypothetical protein